MCVVSISKILLNPVIAPPPAFSKVKAKGNTSNSCLNLPFGLSEV